MAAQSNNVDKYSFSSEYSLEDIKKVIKLEVEEQERRINDKDGEAKKKLIAHQVSELFGENLRATWFQSGSTFVLNLLSSVRNAGKQALKSQPAQALNNKIHQATVAASHKAGEVGLKAQQAAGDLAAKGISAAGDIKDKSINSAQAVVHDIKDKSIETAHDASLKAQEAAISAKGSITDKVSELALSLKSAIASMSLFQRLGNLTGNTNMTYAHLEMEKERAFRISGANEYHSIQNAKKVANLIKDLSSLYRPASEPFAHYHTKLLEEAERSRRISEAQSDKAAVGNARSVSSLINGGVSNPLLQPQFTRAAEESERERRVELAQKDKAALDNARTLSTLIKSELSTPAAAAM